MSWTRNLFCLAVVSIALALVLAATRTAETKRVQGTQNLQNGVASLVANVPVEATLQVRSGKLLLKGRSSALLEISAAELKRGVITVRQFNLVFPEAPQAAISGRKPKSKNASGTLSISMLVSDRPVRLNYEAKSQTASGEIPVQAHFPQLDELFPKVFVKDGRESVLRTQRGQVRLELKFAEPPDSAAGRAAKGKAARLNATLSAKVEVEPLQDGGILTAGYQAALIEIKYPIEIP